MYSFFGLVFFVFFENSGLVEVDLLLLSEFFLFLWVFCFLLISCFSFDWLCCAVVYSKRIVRSQCSCPPGGN